MKTGHCNTSNPPEDGGRLPRLIVCHVVGSRTQAVIRGQPLIEKGRPEGWEAFFRDLLRLNDNQRVVIREVYE